MFKNFKRRFFSFFLFVIVLFNSFSFNVKASVVAAASAIPVEFWLTLIGASGVSFSFSDNSSDYSEFYGVDNILKPIADDFSLFKYNQFQSLYDDMYNSFSDSFDNLVPYVDSFGDNAYKLCKGASSALSSFFNDVRSYFSSYSDTVSFSSDLITDEYLSGDHYLVRYSSSTPYFDIYTNIPASSGYSSESIVVNAIATYRNSAGFATMTGITGSLCFSGFRGINLYSSGGSYRKLFGVSASSFFVCDSFYLFGGEVSIPCDVSIPFGVDVDSDYTKDVWLPSFNDSLSVGKDVVINTFDELTDYDNLSGQDVYGVYDSELDSYVGGLIDFNADTTFVPDYPDTDTALDYIGGILIGLGSAISSLPSLIIGEGTIDFSSFYSSDFDLTSFFPFCIPFDLVDCISHLSASPRVPTFTFDFSGTAMDEFGSYQISFSQFEPLAVVVRYFIFLFTSFGIIVLTRRLIKG